MFSVIKTHKVVFPPTLITTGCLNFLWGVYYRSCTFLSKNYLSHVIWHSNNINSCNASHILSVFMTFSSGVLSVLVN